MAPLLHRAAIIKQEMIERQWHHLVHVQIISTSLRIDNHAITLSLIFYRPRALPDVQPTGSSAKGKKNSI